MTPPERGSGAGSPADLALASFGAGRFASVAGEARADDWAVVLVLTNEEPYLVPYEVDFHRDGATWAEVSGNDSPGWRSTGNGRGFVTFWGEAPDSPARVSVSYRGATAVVPVSAGHFLAVFWDIREGDFDPEVLPEISPPG